MPPEAVIVVTAVIIAFSLLMGTLAWYQARRPGLIAACNKPHHEGQCRRV